jgi:hypothetical protein
VNIPTGFYTPLITHMGLKVFMMQQWKVAELFIFFSNMQQW